ncbi:MAG: WD40 repeat domain-containing protein [Gemmataceae bacterium]|nr:WD40 repeat domain-containing protein [Gemmataceae bacterium]
MCTLVFLVAILPLGFGAQQESTVAKTHQGWVGAVAFSPDGVWQASGGADKKVLLIGDKEAATVLIGHTDAVTALAFSPDSKTLASASFDGAVRLWDLVNGKQSRILQGQRGAVLCVAFSPDGKFLVSGGFDAKVRVWDPATGKVVQTLTEHQSWINAATFSKQGLLATGSSDNTVRLWTLENGRWQPKDRFEFSEGEVRSLAFAPDGATLAAGVRYGTLKIIDVQTRKVVSKKAHKADVWAVAFSPDGKLLASGDGDWDQPGDVCLWNTGDWNEHKVLKTSNEVLALAFAPNGLRLVAGCWDGKVQRWDLE